MSRNIKQHLTQDEFIGFTQENLPEEVEKEVGQHLECCVSCTKKLEDFYAAQEEFPSEQWGKERDAFILKLRQRIFPGEAASSVHKTMYPGGLVEKLRNSLQSFLAGKVCYSNIGLGLAFKTPSAPLDIESEDGGYGIFIKEAPNGDVKIYLDSIVMELEGITVHLYAGGWAKDVQLNKVNDTQLGAKILITRAEREAMPQGAVLRARLINEKDVG